MAFMNDPVAMQKRYLRMCGCAQTGRDGTEEGHLIAKKLCASTIHNRCIALQFVAAAHYNAVTTKVTELRRLSMDRDLTAAKATQMRLWKRRQLEVRYVS